VNKNTNDHYLLEYFIAARTFSWFYFFLWQSNIPLSYSIQWFLSPTIKMKFLNISRIIFLSSWFAIIWQIYNDNNSIILVWTKQPTASVATTNKPHRKARYKFEIIFSSCLIDSHKYEGSCESKNYKKLIMNFISLINEFQSKE
jgi:hypothetical protein